MEGIPLQNPREKASFLSLLTFSWINNVLKLGSKKPLEEKHLFEVETSDQAERLVADLEREWLAEKRASEQNRTKPRLWKAMMRVISYRDYATVVLIRIFYSLSSFSLPLLLWFFLRSISTSSRTSYSTTLVFVISIALTSIVRMFCNTHWVFKAEVISIRLKVAVIGFVYKKVSHSSFTPDSIISHSSILLMFLLLILFSLSSYFTSVSTSFFTSSFLHSFTSILFISRYFFSQSSISSSTLFYQQILLFPPPSAFPIFPLVFSLDHSSSFSLCSFSTLFHHPLFSSPAPFSISLLLLPFASFSSFPHLVHFSSFSTFFSFPLFLLTGVLISICLIIGSKAFKQTI